MFSTLKKVLSDLLSKCGHLGFVLLVKYRYIGLKYFLILNNPVVWRCLYNTCRDAESNTNVNMM